MKNDDIVKISIEDLGIDRDDLEMRIRQQIKPGGIIIQKISDSQETVNECAANYQSGRQIMAKRKSLFELSWLRGCSVGELLVLAAGDTAMEQSDASNPQEESSHAAGNTLPKL